MTRIWVILWAVFVVFSVVVADGNVVAQVPGNHSVGQEKHTGHGEKFLYTEGGSFSSKETQKSVKKELVEPPPPNTYTNLTSGNETKGIPGNTTNGNSPESKNTTLPDVKTPAKNTTIPLAKETLPESSKNSTKVNITGKNEGILHGNATATPPKYINVTTPSTTTTTTPRPKKPTLTVSVVDDPNLLEAASKSAPKHPQSPESGRLDVEEPVAQLSQENILELPVNHRDYIVPIVVLIFAIPMILGLATVVIRRFKDYWLTRHYRRMDYLLDGMYNE